MFNLGESPPPKEEKNTTPEKESRLEESKTPESNPFSIDEEEFRSSMKVYGNREYTQKDVVSLVELLDKTDHEL